MSELRDAMTKFLVTHEFIEEPTEKQVDEAIAEALEIYGDEATALQYARNDFCSFGEWIK